MIKLLVKLFIKDYNNTSNQNVREKYGVLGGVLGIICNVFLFVVKLTIGLIVNAFSIVSDAFNNLTDSLSSIIGIISAKFSNKKPDKDHPFGHGRFEYVSTLIVSFIIMLVGFELAMTSITNFIDLIKGNETIITVDLKFYISISILAVSLLVKLWMFSYNKYLGKKIDSGILLANSADSISDVCTSTALLIALIFGGIFFNKYYGYIDSSLSLIVSAIIIINGFKIFISTIGVLIGKPASKDEYESLEKLITSSDKILGVHDLIIHDYGPGRKFASVHAEISSDENMVIAHEIIDEIEQICYVKQGIELTIHMDPIDKNSKEVVEANNVICSVINSYEDLHYHDLRITNGEHNINVIFDLVVPHRYTNDQIKTLINEIKSKVKELNPCYTLVIKIDRPFHE